MRVIGASTDADVLTAFVHLPLRVTAVEIRVDNTRFCVRRLHEVTPGCVTQCQGCSFLEQYPEALRPEDGGITQALVQMARENAIEECAQVAEKFGFGDSMYNQQPRYRTADSIALEIRALKQSTPQGDSR